MTVQATAPRTVTFTLETPLGGFLQAATQPIAPAHLLADVPVADLAGRPVRSPADRVRPVRGRQPRPTARRAHPGSHHAPGGASGAGARPRVAPTRWRRPAAGRPNRPVPYLAGMDFTFFDDPRRSPTRTGRASLDAASGLPPALAADLGRPGSRARSATRGDDDGGPAQSPTGPPRVLEPGGPDGAARGDRPRRHLTDAFASAAAPATGPIPPSSALFDPIADPPVPYDPAPAEAALKEAGWTKAADGWRLPGRQGTARDRAAQPGRGVEPGRVSRRPRRSPATGRRSGLTVTHVAAAARRVRDRASGDRQVPASRSGT